MSLIAPTLSQEATPTLRSDPALRLEKFTQAASRKLAQTTPSRLLRFSRRTTPSREQEASANHYKPSPEVLETHNTKPQQANKQTNAKERE